jgi:signal transduction histidine kinase
MSWLDSARARIVLAALAALALVLDGRLAQGSDAPLALVIVLAIATCLPFVFGDRVSLASVLGLEAGLVACVLVFHAYDASVGILAFVLFLAAVEGDRRRSMIVGVATALVLALTLARLQTTGHGLEAGTVIRVLLVLGALVLGDAQRSRRALRTARRERAAREHHEREQRARQRIARERLGIARDLHDTIAHALVAINVRAGVATHLGSESQDAGALAEIKQVSGHALRDLRATLDLLRDGSEDSPWLPAQGLEELPQLLEGVGSAGLATCSHVELDDVAVPAPVSQTAFRIVQESLTNVLRHAGATRAEVNIRASAELLAVEVTDDGRGSANGTGADAGHGLRGMSERVLALGGELSAGPLEPRGWRVLAHLPLAQTAS